VLRQHLQPSIQRLEALFGDFVGGHVINTDLQMFQACAVQALDALLIQKKIRW